MSFCDGDDLAGDVISDTQDLALCIGCDTSGTCPEIIDEMQDALVVELSNTLANYDDRFLASLELHQKLTTRNLPNGKTLRTSNVKKSSEQQDGNSMKVGMKLRANSKGHQSTLFDVRLGIELLQYLLAFIVEADDQDISQRRIILEQVTQLLSNMSPLSLIHRNCNIPITLTASVVDALRDFLLQMALPTQPTDVAFRDLAAYANQFALATTALVRVASARGSASDLLYIIYVLLQASLCTERHVCTSDGLARKRITSSECGATATALNTASLALKKMTLRKEMEKAQKVRILPGKDKATPPCGKSKVSGDAKPGASSTCPQCHTTDCFSNSDGHLNPLLRQVWASKAQLDESDVIKLAKQLCWAEPYARKSTDQIESTATGCSEVWSCGQNSYGELAHGDSTARSLFKRVDSFQGKNVVQVAAGNEHTVLLTESGAVYTSGYNDNGQCGQGMLHSVDQPRQVSKLEGSKVMQIHAYNGCEHTLVLLQDGRLVSFGYNYRGQLGLGNTTSQAVPRGIRALEGRRVTFVSCSYHHTVVACQELEVFSFGRNDFGQLGHGDSIDRKTPELIAALSGEVVISVACGQYHTCIARKDAPMLACGKNDYGQLGFTDSDSVNSMKCMPNTSPDMSHVRMLRCGYYHTVVLTEAGQVYGFGRNDYGQLGLGHTTQRIYGPSLVEYVGNKNITTIAAGCYHTILVEKNGMLHAFGRNNHGQIGTGDTIDRHTPYAIDRFLGKHVVSVAAGFYHTVVLTRNLDSTWGSRPGRRDAPPYSATATLEITLPQFNGLDDRASNCDLFRTQAVLSPSSDDTTAIKSSLSQTTSIRNSEMAVFILAHMDRLISLAFPSDRMDELSPSATSEKRKGAFLGGLSDKFLDDFNGGTEQRLYCIDASPDTFEVILLLLITVLAHEPSDASSDEHSIENRENGDVVASDDSAGEAAKQTEQKPRHALTAYEFKYMLLALLRILRVNVEFLLHMNSPQAGESKNYVTATRDIASVAICLGEHVSMPHAAIYEHFEAETIRVSPGQGRRRAKESNSSSRTWKALCGLQHQLVLILQAPPNTAANSDLVQQEAAAVLMLGIDLFYPCQIHQAQLIIELLSVEFELSQTSERDQKSSLAMNGRTQAKRFLLNKLLQRLSSDEVASRLVPNGFSNERSNLLTPRSKCSSAQVPKTLLMLSATLFRCVVLTTAPVARLLTTPFGGSDRSVFTAAPDAASTQDLLKNAILALQKHLLSWAASALTSPTPSFSHLRHDDTGPAAVASACSEARSQASQTPTSLRCLADYAEMIIGFSLEFVNGEKPKCIGESLDVVLADSDSCFGTSMVKEPRVWHNIQESVVGHILQPLVAGMLPLAHLPPLGRRLLKHLTHLLRTFDNLLQQVFALKVSLEDSQESTRQLQLEPHKNQSYDFQKLAWLQDLTKMIGILVGRFAGAIFAGDAWVTRDNASIEDSQCHRWLHSHLLSSGLERNCRAIIERQGVLPEDAVTVRDTLNAARSFGQSPYQCWEDAVDDLPMLDWMCQWFRRDLSDLDRSYSIVMRQISGQQQTLVTNFECAMLAVLLKTNDVIHQARLIFAKRQNCQSEHQDYVPQRFLAISCVIARATVWLWSCRSQLRASARQSDSDEFVSQATRSVRSLLIFASEFKEKSWMLSYFPSISDEDLVRPSSKYACALLRAVMRLRSVLRWQRLYKRRSESDARVLVRVMRQSSMLHTAYEIVDFLSDICDPKRASVAQMPSHIYKIIICVVRNYHRAFWRKAGIQTFHHLLRSLETQSCQACVLFCLTQLRAHPLIQGHFLHDLAATDSELRKGIEEKYEGLWRQITSIVRCISLRNARIRADSIAKPSLLGAAEAQLLLVALNSLGWKYSCADWRYLRNDKLIQELHGVIEVLDISYSSIDRRNGRMTEYSSQMRSLITKQLGSSNHGAYSTDLSRAKLCLKAAWNLLRLLVLSALSTGSPSASSVSQSHMPSYAWNDSFKPIFDVLYSIAKRELIKLDACNTTLAEKGEEADLIDASFRPTSPLSCNSQETEVMSPKGNQQRRCQELLTTPIQFANLETGVHISEKRIILSSECQDFSIMFWVHITQNATGHYRILFASGSSKNWLVVLLRDADLRLEVGLVAESSRNICDRIVTKSALSLNRWTHLGLVSEGTKLKLYIDGTLDQKSNCDASCASGQQIYLGKLPDGVLPLDGVRGGLEGSIARLRYYTRALSPIHVRILCDQGAPRGAQSSDRSCNQICALLFLSSQLRSTQDQLCDLKWQELLFNMLLFGTSRVQLAVSRIMHALVPNLAPEKLAMIQVRNDWFQHNSTSGSRRGQCTLTLCSAFPSPKSQAFAKTVLLIVGLSLWRIDNVAVGLLRSNDIGPKNSQGRDRSNLSMLLPRNLLRWYTGIQSMAESQRHDGTSESLEDVFVLAAELSSLVQVVSRREQWRQVLHEVAKGALQDDQRAPIIPGVDEVLKFAVLNVFGGFSDKLRPGAAAIITQTNAAVRVIALESTLSMAHVVVEQSEYDLTRSRTRQGTSSKLPKVIRISTVELKLLHQSSNALDGLIREEDFLETSIVPCILQSFDRSADFCLHVLGIAKYNASASNSHIDALAFVSSVRCLVHCLKILQLLISKEKWMRLLGKFSGLFARVCALSRVVDSTNRFLSINCLEVHTISLRERLFQARSLSSLQENQVPKHTLSSLLNTVSSEESSGCYSEICISTDNYAPPSDEKEQMASEMVSWIVDDMDILIAAPEPVFSESESRVLPAIQADEAHENSRSHEELKIGGEPYICDVYKENYFIHSERLATTKLCDNLPHENSLPSGWDTCYFKDGELLSACWQMETSLAILYARKFFVRVVHAGAIQLLPPEAIKSPSSILRLLRLYVFRGSQFPDFTISNSGALVTSRQSHIQTNEPVLVDIFHRFLQRSLLDDNVALGSYLLEHCLRELEVAASARNMRSRSWFHRILDSSDSDAVFHPNVEFVTWLLSELHTARVAGSFGVPVFMRLLRCFMGANYTLRHALAATLCRIVQVWSDYLRISEGSDTAEPSDLQESDDSAGMPSKMFLSHLFSGRGVMPRLRKMQRERLSLERSQKRICFSPYLSCLSELLGSLIALEDRYVCLQEPGAVNKTDIFVQSPQLLEATSRSLHVTWPHATTTYCKDVHPILIYELQLADSIAGMDNNEVQFRTVYRGSQPESVVDGLVPLRTYTLRVSAILRDVQETLDPTRITSPCVQLRTQSGTAFAFDDESCGEGITVSEGGLTAMYTGNETWSMILGNEPLVAGCNHWEVRIDDSPTSCIFVGVATRFADVASFLGGDEHSWGYIGDRALYHNRMKVKVYGERYAMGDVIGVTLDMNHGVLSFAKNGFDLGIAFDGLAGELYPAIAFYNQGQRVSVRTSSYRCPGIGDVIPEQRRFHAIEELGDYCNLMRSLFHGTQIPQKWLYRAFSWYTLWCTGTMTRHPTFAGFEINLDTSVEACLRFGTKSGEFIQISRGRARVIGVASGLLWLCLDGQDVAWFLTPSEIQRMRALGYLRSNITEGRAQEAAGAETVNADKIHSRSPLLLEKFKKCVSLNSWSCEADAIISCIVNEASAKLSSNPWNLRPSHLLEILHKKPRAEELIITASSSAPEISPDDTFLCRAALLYAFNEEVQSMFPFASVIHSHRVENSWVRQSIWPKRRHIDGIPAGGVDACQPHSEYLSALLDGSTAVNDNCSYAADVLFEATRTFIFTHNKQKIFHAFVQRTITRAKPVDDDYDYPDDLPQVSLNRLTAMTSKRNRDLRTSLSQSIFGQLYESLHFLRPRLLRMGYTHPMDDAQERTFKVKFEGEGVDDYGGPFREIFVQTPLELQATYLEKGSERCSLPLLLPLDDKSKFVPTPAPPCRMFLEMFAFLGKLLGVALRCKVSMHFDFPLRIWKALVNDALGLDDIATVAQPLFAEVEQALDEVTSRGVQRSSIPISSGLLWTTTLSDGQEIELKPNGRTLPVLITETEQYVADAVANKLNESREALLAMRAGLESIIPAAVLRIITGSELERMVCGLRSIDLELLRKNTEYDDDIHPDDPHIVYLWEALRSFDEDERAAFLRFVWARTSLPIRQQEFHQKFKVQSAVGEGPSKDPDNYLPKAHTCFFSINLPKYSSVAVMTEKLKYAIHNTVEMDADFRLAENEMIRWFETD